MIQMGMELLVHVLDCEQKGIVKDRYVITTMVTENNNKHIH